MVHAGLACLLLAPHAAAMPPASHRGATGLRPASKPPANGAHRGLLVGQARGPRMSSLDDDDDDDDDDVAVMERESVRESGLLFGEKGKEGRTQVYGAWLDDAIVGNRGDTREDSVSTGVAAMRAGLYTDAVAAFETAVFEAGGEGSSKGGQMCIWLAQAMYAKGEPKVAVAMLVRIANDHSSPNVRKAAKEIAYILDAPELKLDASNFVQIPDKIRVLERIGENRGEYAKMEKKPERYSLEWYMLQPPAGSGKGKRKADPIVGIAVVAIVGLAAYVGIAVSVVPA
ncbi:hypothetical protein T492DRAFT_1027430 [Pavlovales sp. CCMP2436]|nr:hypothetical protein T492DRAFT_1027430 [Pavlovales sp. CCMP2436]|mmetsp:Transcript_4058/g.10343  ORF Transcript_4058/g.10343 Transcript_4058/m.10343 type:complete len:286 (+) Transcript_4058:223-1080(+)